MERGRTYSGVTVPDIHVDIREGAAGVGVDQLDVHVKGDTFLVLDNILADQFTSDVCIHEYITMKMLQLRSSYSTVPG